MRNTFKLLLLLSCFSNFSCRFLDPNYFYNYNCSNVGTSKIKHSVSKICWPFIVQINCSSDLKNLANSRPLASNFRSFFSITRTIFSHSRSEQFWKQNTISVRKHQKSCFASHFEFVVSYAITITILAYLLHLAKLCNTNEILSEEVCIFISKYI